MTDTMIATVVASVIVGIHSWVLTALHRRREQYSRQKISELAEQLDDFQRREAALWMEILAMQKNCLEVFGKGTTFLCRHYNFELRLATRGCRSWEVMTRILYKHTCLLEQVMESFGEYDSAPIRIGDKEWVLQIERPDPRTHPYSKPRIRFILPDDLRQRDKENGYRGPTEI